MPGLSGWGGGSDPAPKCRCLQCRQRTQGSCTSPVLSTSGRLWLGPAWSFSYLWSSQSSAITVSPRRSRWGAVGFAPAHSGACSGQPLRAHGVEISETLSCTARPGTAYFFLETGRGEAPLLPFSTLWEVFWKTEPYLTPGGSMRGVSPPRSQW